MTSIVGGSQRNTGSPMIELVSQIGGKNIQQKYQQIYKQRQNEEVQKNSFAYKNNIDHLYDQNSELLVFQQGKAQIKPTAMNQRNSQINVSNYLNHNMDSIIKQNSIKQNQSPWRRNLTNQSNVTGIGNGSKNGFYNNEQSTFSSLSRQNQLIMSPNSQNENEQQQKRSQNNSSYFLHVDQSLQSNQNDNLSISKYQHNFRQFSHIQKKGNDHFNLNSPNNEDAQQNSSIKIHEVQKNNQINKCLQRKNYEKKYQKSVGVESNQMIEEKQHPLMERGSSDKKNHQKKLRLHSLNVNIHRIFKEDKSLNNQDNSDSSDKSNKVIVQRKEEFQTRTSQENISSKDHSALNMYLNLDDPTVKDNEKNEKKEINSKNQNLNFDKFSQQLKQHSAENRQSEKVNQKQQIDFQNSKEIPQGNIINNGYQIVKNNGGCKDQKQNQAEKKQIQNTNSLDESLNYLVKKCVNKDIGCQTQMKIHHTEPQKQRRYCSQGKRKNNFNYKLNDQLIQNNSNQQIKTQPFQKNQYNNNKMLSLNNSPRNNCRQRSITQESTLGFPAKSILSEINPNDQQTTKQSQNDISIYMKDDNKKNESQQNIQFIKENANNYVYLTLLHQNVQTNQPTEIIESKDMANSAMKNYINNSLMIQKSYRNICKEQQKKQFRTQIDSQMSLQNKIESKEHSPRQNYTEKDTLSMQLLSNQGNFRVPKQQDIQENYKFISLDDRYTMKDTHFKLSGNFYESKQAKGSVPLLKQENNIFENEDPKYLDQIQNIKNKQNGNKLNYLKQQVSSQNNWKSNDLQNNKAISSQRVNNSHTNNVNNHTYTSQDKRQQRIRIRNKVYSNNSQNNSLNTSILEKSQLYVEKFKFNHQNDLSLIQNINKQKQIRENDLYNVSTAVGQPSTINKKYEQFNDVDKKIQQLSHQVIEPQDLQSNQYKSNYQNNFQQKNQQTRNTHYRKQQVFSNSSQSNPYSPKQSTGNTQISDQYNIPSSLSHNLQNDFHKMNDHELTANLIQCLSNQKNEQINSAYNYRENDNSCVNNIWRKLTYTKNKNKTNQSSLEEELLKVELLSKKNEQALNQYVQIKDDAVQMSQFMQSQINIRRQDVRVQGNT